ncbi:type VI secretion system accessory protein TagJ [Labrys sp. KB_33_2]|uniref:type VI secretion system accessory protein TagJ n=1 Tax=Labrys sp. KB_33_2 TaxID=3237479 RepID=UPI003F9105AC
MTLAASIANSLSEGALSQALDHAREHMRAHPSDKDARHLYIDLLILAGDYERADTQCSLAVTLAPQDTMGFALLRNQLRAMAARKAWFETGAVPEFPHGPSALDRAAIELAIINREGSSAGPTLAALDGLRGERPMLWNGEPVGDFRDLDDRVPHALEVIMTGGSYLWIDFAKIASVAVEPIARPRDLAFRRAELSLADGASASVLLPAIYQGTEGRETLLLGRETEWVTEPSGITAGRGQRCFLAGDELVSFHDMQSLGMPEIIRQKQAAHG